MVNFETILNEEDFHWREKMNLGDISKLCTVGTSARCRETLADSNLLE